MKDGFIRVGAATPAARVADPAFNANAAVKAATVAAASGVRVLVFPELTLTTYTCSDLFFQQTLLDAAEGALRVYMKRTAALDMISFIGVPVLFHDKIYNCAAAVAGGKLLGLTAKVNLPNYNEFYEARHFTPAPKENFPVSYAGQNTLLGARMIFTCESMPGLRLAAEICEDLWVANAPSVRHAAAGATVIVNLSASDEVVGKADYRRALVTMQSAKLTAGYVYADAGDGESGTDTVYSGHNLIAENGRLAAEAPPFSGKELIFAELDMQKISAERRKTTTVCSAPDDAYDIIPFSLSVGETELSSAPPRFPFVPDDPTHRAERCRLILNMQAHGLAGRMERAHAKCAVIGVSGGLDSTLALLVAVRAADMAKMGRKRMIAVTMPCFGTTARTKGNAEKMAESLGVTLRTVDIQAAVRQHFSDIGHDADNFNVVYENAQARERTQVLMDIANAEGGLVVGTGDLSELALGWATYNGDHMSMYAVNASVPKTLVRHIVAFVADEAEAAGRQDEATVLRDVLATPVSPELLPPKDGKIAQCTEGIVGPYELHDYFLYHFVRFGFSPEKIFRLAALTFRGIYDEETIRLWLGVFVRRFFAQQFKRSCLPDGPKVGTVVLSPRADWRMPSDASAAAWLRMFDEKQK